MLFFASWENLCYLPRLQIKNNRYICDSNRAAFKSKTDSKTDGNN